MAVVNHINVERVLAVAHRDGGADFSRVFAGVGQRLLHDPVCRKLDTKRQYPAIALDGEVHRHTHSPSLLNQRFQLAQSRLRREATLRPVFAEHTEQPAHLGQRLASGLLDREHRLERPRGVESQHLLSGPGLHDHDTERVSDHVVEFAGDPLSLLLGGGLHPLELFTLESLHPLGVHPGLVVPRPHDSPDEQRQPHPEHAEHEVADALVLAGHRDRDPDPDDCDSRKYTRRRGVHDQRVGGNRQAHQRDDRLLDRDSGDAVERHRDGRDQCHHKRELPSPHQRRGGDEGDR